MDEINKDFDWDYLDKEFGRIFKGIKDFNFARKEFHTKPALISLEPIKGYIKYAAYDGQEYDEKKYKIEDGKWDHEHCSLSLKKIRDGDTYYANSNEVIILCEEVYKHYKTEIENRKKTT